VGREDGIRIRGGRGTREWNRGKERLWSREGLGIVLLEIGEVMGKD